MTLYFTLRAFAIGRCKYRTVCRSLGICALASILLAARATAQDQEDPLNKVHVGAPPAAAAPPAGAPAGAEAPAVTGPAALKAHPGAIIRMNVDMVLIP